MPYNPGCNSHAVLLALLLKYASFLLLKSPTTRLKPLYAYDTGKQHHCSGDSMHRPENDAILIHRLATLLAPVAKSMLPLRANSASNAVAQIRLAGSLLSKLLGLVHFSLGHMLPAQYSRTHFVHTISKPSSALLNKPGRCRNIASRKLVSIAKRPLVVTPSHVPPLSRSRPANKHGQSDQK